MGQELTGMLRPILAPAIVLAAATLLAWLAPPLPPTLEGLRTLGPFALLAATALVCAWFNRGRALLLALSILGAYSAWRFAPALPRGGARALELAVALLVPLNALAALLAAERGVRHHGGWRWLVLLGAEAALLAWLVLAALARAAAWQEALGHWLLRSPPVPLAVRLAFAAAFAAAVWRAWPEHRPLDVGLAGALALFFIASAWIGQPGTFVVFVAAAGVALLVAVLQESHRMAFRDALTGLPNRRALEEALRALGPTYTVAMADVDHFKSFNDAHGHDIGDQVLRLVGARLAQVAGGGRAYRYGGEEFTVLFPGAAPKEALPQLEAARASVEGYRMALRGADRPEDQDEGARQRGGRAAEKSLSVTISIGLAGPRSGESPEQVVKAADEALYRAKQAGRNRVSR